VADKRTRATRTGDLARLLVEVSPDAPIALTPTGEIRSWNNAAQTIFGYTSAEAVGRSFYELIVPPDHLDETRRAMAVTLDTGAASYESVSRTKDGSRILVDVSQRLVRDAERSRQLHRRQPEGRHRHPQPAGDRPHAGALSRSPRVRAGRDRRHQRARAHRPGQWPDGDAVRLWA
jgi:PAS domain S-box-containing protein